MMLTRRHIVAGLAPAALLAACSTSTRATSSSTTPSLGKSTPKPYAPAVRNGRLLVIGDSITFGMGASAPDLGYAYQLVLGLQARHSGQGANWLLHGVPGITASEMLGCMQRMSSSETADLVVVELGTNDAGRGVPLEAFRASYRLLLALVRRQSPAATIVGLTCWHDSSWVTPSGDSTAAYSAAIVEALGMQVGGDVQSIDISAWYFAEGYRNPSGDTFHPSDVGHAAIARAILDLV